MQGLLRILREADEWVPARVSACAMLGRDDTNFFQIRLCSKNEEGPESPGLLATDAINDSKSVGREAVEMSGAAGRDQARFGAVSTHMSRIPRDVAAALAV